MENICSFERCMNCEHSSCATGILSRTFGKKMHDAFLDFIGGYLSPWIDIDDDFPTDGDYVLVSFENFDLPDIGRYEEDEEGGAFYPVDSDLSYTSMGYVVNGWIPLPSPHRPD